MTTDLGTPHGRRGSWALAGAPDSGLVGFGHSKKIHVPTQAQIRRGNSDTDVGLVQEGNFRRLPGEVFG